METTRQNSDGVILARIISGTNNTKVTHNTRNETNYYTWWHFFSLIWKQGGIDAPKPAATHKSDENGDQIEPQGGPGVVSVCEVLITVLNSVYKRAKLNPRKNVPNLWSLGSLGSSGRPVNWADLRNIKVLWSYELRI